MGTSNNLATTRDKKKLHQTKLTINDSIVYHVVSKPPFHPRCRSRTLHKAATFFFLDHFGHLRCLYSRFSTLKRKRKIKFPCDFWWCVGLSSIRMPSKIHLYWNASKMRMAFWSILETGLQRGRIHHLKHPSRAFACMEFRKWIV